MVKVLSEKGLRVVAAGESSIGNISCSVVIGSSLLILSVLSSSPCVYFSQHEEFGESSICNISCFIVIGSSLLTLFELRSNCVASL